MREIKFRAWDGKKMNYLDEINLCSVPMSGIVQMKIAPDVIVWEKEESQFMQYTGLNDKTGREIYEGDIVEGINYNMELIKNPVIWEHSGWYIGYADGERKLIDYLDSCSELKVIGNIYEHPELLKK